MEQVLYDIKLSRNFHLSEFVKSKTANLYAIDQQFVLSDDIICNIKALVTNVLQPLRNDVGAIKINSGYRCQELNNKVGGVPTSQHLSGMASDIVCEDIRAAACYIIQRDYDQLIIYKNFLHVSYNQGFNRKETIFKTM